MAKNTSGSELARALDKFSAIESNVEDKIVKSLSCIGTNKIYSNPNENVLDRNYKLGT